MGIKEDWNAQADGYNQFHTLDSEEVADFADIQLAQAYELQDRTQQWLEEFQGTTADLELQLAQANEEIGGLQDSLIRQGNILTGVANALKGEPGELQMHSHHDLAERAAQAKATI